MRFACGYDVIVGFVLLQHQPHGADVVARKSPVAFRIQIAEIQLSCVPSLMRANARVILRVTNVSPRLGDSWLNRIPLQAKMLYPSR